MIHFDTNYLVLLLIPGSAEDRAVRELRAGGEEFNISAMAWAEFLCGPVSPGQLAVATGLLPAPEPLLAPDASFAATLFNATGRRRGSLPDCLIAACAIRSGAILATNNLNDFRRFESYGLRLYSSV